MEAAVEAAGGSYMIRTARMLAAISAQQKSSMYMRSVGRVAE